MRIILMSILVFLSACAKSDNAGSVVQSNSYYIQTTDPDSSPLDITMVLYADSTFKLYAARGFGSTYNKYEGSFTASSVTVTLKTCSGQAGVTMRGITEGTGSAIMLFDATNGSVLNQTSTFSSTKPTGFTDYITATENCYATGIF